MTETPLCTLIIPADIPIAEVNSLETSLRLSSVKVQKLDERVIGADDLVLVLSGAAAAAQLVDYSIKVAKAIIEWRRKLEEKKIEPKGKLEQPDKPPLDLAKATDEEIEEWLSQNPEK